MSSQNFCHASSTVNLFPALFPWEGQQKKLSLPLEIPRTAVFLSFFQDGINVALRSFAASVGVLLKAQRRNFAISC